MIVRRRLAQKMTFASEDTANLPEPDEAALRAFFEKTKADYQAPPRVTFRHQFFNSDRGKDQALERAKAALGKVGAGQGDPLGEPFLLPLSYSDASLIDLNKDYGQDFAGVLLTAPLNQWSGPIASAYGYHLIKVDSRTSAKTPTLDEVRSDVLAAYQEQARKARNAAFLDGLRKKYRVEISGIPQTVLTQP
jgi:parvulin-like peptidyl-prolyl isomerase